MSRHPDTFNSRAQLSLGQRDYTIYRLDAAPPSTDGPLPFTLRVLLENLLRHEDGDAVTGDDIRALAAWDPRATPSREIAFTPSRVLLQDFTGVPAVVDLAAMRDAMVRLGGKAEQINPLLPAELVIDHSVQVDMFGSVDALSGNADREYQRNAERYRFLRWGQSAFDDFAVVPPSTGIVHQVNIEYLARVVFDGKCSDGSRCAYPDTLVGTDSHTTMVNALGVLGWGVGGIEAEAAMLGQPVSMLIPQVVGFRLLGSLPEGSTATDLVLTVVEMLRQKGVVGKLVEFFGSGLPALPLADRATIANMAPEYGATCGFFPVDEETLRYLRLTGRDETQVALVEAYCREQGLFFDVSDPEPRYSDVLELDLSTVEPSIAGPKRPQDRLPLSRAGSAFKAVVPSLLPATASAERKPVAIEIDGVSSELRDGSIVIAAITSCTNTSNPSVMLAAGLLAQKAVQRGLTRQPWVKTSLAPGSKVVTEYLSEAGLDTYLEKLGFHTVGYGCTTCIGNSGPLPEAVAKAIADHPMVLCSVLSGNRNFEGRIHADIRANYLMSPPLVVAYAIAGRMDIELDTDPLGSDADGKPVFLRDIWPSAGEVAETLARSVHASMFSRSYGTVFEGDEHWKAIATPSGQTFAWDGDSTYIKHPPFFETMSRDTAPVEDIVDARVLALLGDSVTTDHISPAGSIHPTSPAADYLRERGIARQDFNSYGSRRGNHEVMMRGTFANVRLRNHLAGGAEGGLTRHLPGDEVVSIFEASERYRRDGVPTIVLAGTEYGTGSSRDWAGKGPALLGVRAVIAQSYERIHRSNLVGMGVAPLQFMDGESAKSLGLNGEERFAIRGLAAAVEAGAGTRTVTVEATSDSGETAAFTAILRIDTPREAQYYVHGGILRFVLRQLLSATEAS